MTLYELTSEYLDLLAMLEDPDVDEDLINDTLEGIDGELEAKADGYARVMRQMDADAKAIKAEEERLANRRKSLENRSAALKSRLQQMMELTGKTKFKTALYSFNIAKNPASVVIDDESKIPAEYWIAQDPKLNKSALKEMLSTGEICEYAHLEQGQSLRIR